MPHTPGPWKVADPSYGWDHFAAIVTVEGIVGTAHIATLSRDHEETAANALLMAAAPELLASLRHLRAFWQPGSDHDTQEVQHALAAADAAIAKSQPPVIQGS